VLDKCHGLHFGIGQQMKVLALVLKKGLIYNTGATCCKKHTNRSTEIKLKIKLHQ